MVVYGSVTCFIGKLKQNMYSHYVNHYMPFPSTIIVCLNLATVIFITIKTTANYFQTCLHRNPADLSDLSDADDQSDEEETDDTLEDDEEVGGRFDDEGHFVVGKVKRKRKRKSVQRSDSGVQTEDAVLAVKEDKATVVTTTEAIATEIVETKGNNFLFLP